MTGPQPTRAPLHPFDSPERLTIRRSIHIAAPPDRVWLEFTSYERMAAWFGTGHRLLTYEPRAGGWVELEVEVRGVMRRFGGRVTVFEPARELTFEDEWLPSDGTPPLLLTLRLTEALGGTIVELVQHGFEARADGIHTHRGHQAGWTSRQIDALRQIVEGAG